MRLSFILSSLWLSGGVRDIVETANGLCKRGHEISFIVSGGTVDPDIKREIDPSIEIREVSVSGVGKLSLLQMSRLTLALALAVPSSDFVISTQSPTTAAGFIATHLMRQGTPVWYYQDYVEMFLDRPVVVFLLKHALRWNRCAMVLSESSREELLSYVPNGKVVVSGMGLSHASYFRPYSEEERWKCQNGNKTILYLGDMRPRKGWSDFLEAMEMVYQEDPNILLWLVSKDQCEPLSGLPHQFIYRPSREELAHLFATSDVFVSASWWESFGIPPLEAMACGAPVVVTDSRGSREYARPGENCLMVPARSPSKLADAVLTLLKNHELACKLRKNGPPTAAEFTWTAAVDRFEKALIALQSSKD